MNEPVEEAGMGRAPAQVGAGSNVSRGLGGFEALSRRPVLSGSCRIWQFGDDAWLKPLGDLRSRVRSARAGLTLQTNGPAPRPPNAAPHILPSRQALAAFRSFLSAPAPFPPTHTWLPAASRCTASPPPSLSVSSGSSPTRFPSTVTTPNLAHILPVTHHHALSITKLSRARTRHTRPPLLFAEEMSLSLLPSSITATSI